MTRSALRAIFGLAVGALAGIVLILAASSRGSQFTLEMDRDVPAAATGFYDAEREGALTFAWTRRVVTLTLPGLDRREPWLCVVRLRGARADTATLPDVILTVDGVIEATEKTSNDYQDVKVTLPPRPSQPGAVLTLTASNTFQPGPTDPRALGVMVDRWTCAPERPGFVRPPRRAIEAAAAGTAAFGVALAMIGTPPVALAAAVGAIATGQTVPLSREFGPFTPYIGQVAWLALWTTVVLVVVVRAIEWRIGERLTGTARFVAGLTAAMVYLKLLVLLHPSKTIVDALFNAHRLEWVLDGRFFFTQPVRGVEFPYAIGLYVFAAPWSALTNDLVALLRVVVTASDAVAGALLYVLVVRTWGDRWVGAAATALFSVVPLSFVIVGNANMPNAFAQSVAVVTMVAATILPLSRGAWRQVAALAGLAAFALLSHISILTLLPFSLFALAMLYGLLGGPQLRAPARAIALATLIALVGSVAVYYAHFGEAYRSALRVSASQPAVPAEPSADFEVSFTTAGLPVASLPGPSRVAETLKISVESVGWPMGLLALAGLVSMWRTGFRDRIGLAIAAWALTYVVFLVAGLLTPVEAAYQRYANEFVSRTAHATCAAVVLLAARGAVGGWRAGVGGRVAAAGLILMAAWLGVRGWLAWLE